MESSFIRHSFTSLLFTSISTLISLRLSEIVLRFTLGVGLWLLNRPLEDGAFGVHGTGRVGEGFGGGRVAVATVSPPLVDGFGVGTL